MKKPINLNKEAHLIKSAKKYKHPLPSSFGGYRWHEYIKDAMDEYAEDYARQVLRTHGLLGDDSITYNIKDEPTEG